MYGSKTAANSTDQIPGTFDLPAGHSRVTNFVKRWDGNSRTTSKWDQIRQVIDNPHSCRNVELIKAAQDPELWSPNGDTLIHFYERGASRRGASLRVFLADMEASNCWSLIEQHCNLANPDSFLAFLDAQDSSQAPKYDFYFPAPASLSREEANKFHRATRNFFAWMHERPIVGDRLGQALISLYERINEFRPDDPDNETSMLAYMEEQGYCDFRDCPDHALAVLQFSEKFQLRDLWTDAFVHCVGMNERLDSSAEFEVFHCQARPSVALLTLSGSLPLERPKP